MEPRRLRKRYEIKSGSSRSRGVLDTTAESSLPTWNLSDKLKEEKETPLWIYDQKEFLKARDKEIEIYMKISQKINQLSEIRFKSKLKIIESHYSSGKKYWFLIIA